MGLFSKKDKETSTKAEQVTEDYLDQTDEEKILVNKIKRVYRNSYDSKSKNHEEWDKCYSAYKSDYFKKNLPDYKIQEISNFIFSTIETIKPIMLASNPKMMVLPQREENYGKSVNLQYALDHEWDRTKMFTKLNQALSVGLITGTVFIGLFWDSKASNGLGEVNPVIISPFNMFMDTNATCLDDAEIVMYAIYKNVGEICKAWPEKADQIKSQKTSVQDEFLSYGKDQSTNATQNNSVLYIEAYIKDYETYNEEEEEKDEEGTPTGNKIVTTKMKYPKGRQVILAGDVILENGDSPYEDSPFVMWKCYDIPGELWGLGEVQQIISPMESVCELMNSVIESAGLMGNPIWFVDKNSGVDKNSLTNRKGLVVRKNPGTVVTRDTPPALPAYIENMVEVLKKDIEQISGVYDVTRGERPTGITAAAAISALNEQSQGRIKLKVQCIEQLIGEFGSKWIKLIQTKWASERSIRVMGTQYVPNQQEQQNTAQQVMQSMQAAMPQMQQGMGKQMPMLQNGKFLKFITMSGDSVDGDYDVSVVGGSTMAVNKTSKLQQVIQLAQTQAEDGMPMVDRQTVLENSDMFNVSEVIGRFATIAEQKAQNVQPPQPSEQIPYDSLPPEGMVQMAEKGGIKITPEQILSFMATQQQAEVQKNNSLHANDIKKSILSNQMSIEQQREQAKNQMALQTQQTALQSVVGNGSNSNTDSSKDSTTPDTSSTTDTAVQTPTQSATPDPQQAQMAQLLQYLSTLSQPELLKVLQAHPEYVNVIEQISQNTQGK